MKNPLPIPTCKSLKRSLSFVIDAVDTCSEVQNNQFLLDLIYDLTDGFGCEEALRTLVLYEQEVKPKIKRLTDVINSLYEELRLAQVVHLTDRAEKYIIQLQHLPIVAITVHDNSEKDDFPYLDVFAPLPERLHCKRHHLIGEPLRRLPKEISEPRRHYIKKALANGQWETYHYTYEDNFTWKFKVTVVPMPGTEEVITVVQDAEPWQLGYWSNKVEK